MRFKNIEEKPKKGSVTISTSSGLGLLQMVLELDTGRCANEEAEPQRTLQMVLELDPTSVGEENETSFIRVWKSVPTNAF